MLFVHPGLSLEDLPDVPVGGVQDLHAIAIASERDLVVGQGGARAGAPTTANGSLAWISERSVARGGRAGLGRPGGPGRERELDHQRHRDARAG